MGSIYALKEGWEPPFAMALAEQYLPTGPNSLLPMSDLGACLSMADKADTLVGCFGLGNIPTGTADPYALRRAALGISRILLEFGYEIPLSELFEKAYSFYAKDIKWKFSKKETLEKLLEFCQARLKHYFVGEGTETLVVDAVMNGKDVKGKFEADNVWATEKRLNTLKAFMRNEDFTANAQVLKRMTNILAKAEHKLLRPLLKILTPILPIIILCRSWKAWQNSVHLLMLSLKTLWLWQRIKMYGKTV